MQIRTGFKNIISHSAQRSQNSGSDDYIREVILRDDGDVVRFRSVTDSDQEFADQSGVPHVIIEGEFHSVQRTSKGGKGYTENILCRMQFNEGARQWEGKCEHCEAEVKSRSQFLMWVYVYAIYHRGQNPLFNAGDPETTKFKWNATKLWKNLMYKEVVEKYCIWKDGFYMRQTLEAKIARFGTLCDRDYIVTRIGVRQSQSTRRTLEDMEETPMTDEIREGCQDLPTLEDYATRKVRTYTKPSTAIPDEIDLDNIPDEILGVPVAGFGPESQTVPVASEEFTAEPSSTGWKDDGSSFEDIFDQPSELDSSENYIDDLSF